MANHPTLHIIAGPNGAGKTTFAFRSLRAFSGSSRFVNLDEIARGISPLDPMAQPELAARVAISLTASFIHAGQSFSLETTMSGRTHLRTIARAQAAGFEVHLMFFLVGTPEECLARVARRVVEGGHFVPETDVRRWFARGLANLPAYAAACTLWQIFDASPPRPKVIAEGSKKQLLYRAGEPSVRPEIEAWLEALAA